MTNQEHDPADPKPERRKGHSIQGVISFFLAIMLLATLLALIVVIGPPHFWSMRMHLGFGSAPFVLGCGTALWLFLGLVGVGLGLSGLAKPNSSRFYPVLGIVGNSVWAIIVFVVVFFY
jgi:hypothetical protein